MAAATKTRKKATIGPRSEPRRRRRAMAAAVASGAEALLVTHAPDVRYLSGFTGSNAALLLVGTKAALFTDGRYTAQAKQEASGLRVVISARPAAVAACEWMETAGVQRCGFDAAHTTVAAFETMRKAVRKAGRGNRFLALPALVATLREVKDAGEMEHVRAAALLGCRLFDHMLGYLAPGLSEVAVAAELEHQARLAGAEAMSFETIVASGERGALPHGRASAAKLPKRGFVTLDFGVVLGGYCSDMTRTVHLGRPLPGSWEVYDFVLEAQEAAIAAVAPGALAGEVDEAARSVLKRAGLGKYFTHSTGHGVGLEIHEGPRLATKQTQPLAEGMVVTIEPGVYMPGRLGIRIEDMVLVTATGCAVLTPSVKAWTQL